MADDSYVKEKQVRDLTTTMIGVVNDLPQTSEDMGSATAAQGEKADTAVQPAGLVDALNTRIITGAGRPDIPATLTTEVANLVAAATTGAEFRSTNGPQGAWVWMKRGTTWVVTGGDTGWRNIAASVTNGWTVQAAGGLWVRRTAATALLEGYLVGSAATGGVMAPLPNGFEPGHFGSYWPLSANDGGGTVLPVEVHRQLGAVRTSRPTADPKVNYWRFAGSYQTYPSWPTTLPGVAA